MAQGVNSGHIVFRDTESLESRSGIVKFDAEIGTFTAG